MAQCMWRPDAITVTFAVPSQGDRKSHICGLAIPPPPHATLTAALLRPARVTLSGTVAVTRYLLATAYRSPLL